MTITRADPEVRAALSLLEARLNAERRERLIPGMSVAVVHDQATLWAKGFGTANLEMGVPATPKTIYRVASITKLFTATMLLQLRDAGKLSLDDPIEKFLPTFQIKSHFADSGPVTFRQVMTHMAGLPRECSIDRWAMSESPSIGAVLDSLRDSEMVFPPMAKYKYSNLGIAILGHALEVAAGQGYAEYVTQHVLRPLGMSGSSFELSHQLKARMATGYFTTAGEPPQVAPPRPDGGAFVPVGQLRSCVTDMARFLSFQFGDGTFRGRRVLSGSSLREMHSPVHMEPDWKTGTALGWLLRRVCNFPALDYDGGNPGFTTDVMIIPDLKLGIAVFTNTNTDPVSLSQASLELLVPVFRRLQTGEQRAESRAASVDCRPYAGCYRGPWGHEMEIRVCMEGLEALMPGSPTEDSHITFLPQGEHRFRMVGGPQDGETVVFETDAAGKVVRLRGLLFGFQSAVDRVEIPTVRSN